MFSQIKPKLQPLIYILAKPFIKIHPNLISLLGLITALLFFVFMCLQIWIPAIICGIGIIFDLIDGAVARQSGKKSLFGNFLDSTLDRISDALYITAFGFAGIINWPIVISLLISSFIISYTRAKAEHLSQDINFKLNIGIIERPERLIAIFLSLIIYMIYQEQIFFKINVTEIVFIILIILSFITCVQRIVASYKKLTY